MEPEAPLLGKRSRKEIVAVRRQREQEALHDIIQALPFEKVDLLKTTQVNLLQIALSYIKLRNLIQLAKSSNAMSGIASLLSEEELGFRGFLLVVDMSGSILHASKNITSRLGPSIVDTLGRPIGDLLHPEDAREVERALNLKTLGNQQMFVVRMRTSMAGNTRSPSKIEYKTVFVVCQLKNFSKSPIGRLSGKGSESVAAVLLCRTEDLVGIPEIVMGGYIDFVYDKKTDSFSNVDPKTPWLLGYPCEDLEGKNFLLLDHPRDIEVFKEYNRKKKPLIEEQLHKGEVISVPNSRIMTGWGQWVWVSREGWLNQTKNGKPATVSCRIYILGPDDSHTAATPKLQYFVSKGQHNPPLPIDLDLEALKFLDDYTEYTDLLRDLEHGETENTFMHDTDFGYQSTGSTVSTDFGYQNISSTGSTDFGCQSTGSTGSINTLGDVLSNNSSGVLSVTDYGNADIDSFTNHLHCYSFDHPSSIPQSVDPVL